MVEELKFWKDNLRSLSGCSFVPSLSQIDVYFEVASDASGVGVFGYLVDDSKCVLLKRAFSAEEKKESSTYRELLALRDIYLSDFSLDLKDQVVRHLTDNKSVETIMRIGLSVPKLQDMVVISCHMSVRERERDAEFAGSKLFGYLMNLSITSGTRSRGASPLKMLHRPIFWVGVYFIFIFLQ